ncbi:MAG TPA: hypothetical protein VMJ10_10770 [Kofleriaceae bacterium]|nr:hypothetical protein [Kofleriaceae bacterium]
MKRLVLLAVLAVVVAVAGCEYDLDSCARDHTCQQLATGDGGAVTCEMSTAQSCVAATSHQELSWIQTNIFNGQCTFSGCHNGASTPQGMVDLTMANSYSHLVSYTSILEPSRMLVVPSDPKSSYLEVMLGIIAPADATPAASPPPSNVGYMPQDNGGELLCCQKLQAIDRWITMGAMNN